MADIGGWTRLDWHMAPPLTSGSARWDDLLLVVMTSIFSLDRDKQLVSQRLSLRRICPLGRRKSRHCATHHVPMLEVRSIFRDELFPAPTSAINLICSF